MGREFDWDNELEDGVEFDGNDSDLPIDIESSQGEENSGDESEEASEEEEEDDYDGDLNWNDATPSAC